MTDEYQLQEIDNAEQLYRLMRDVVEGRKRIVGTSYESDTVLIIHVDSDAVDLQTRIDNALENIENYIPEFILEGNARGDTQVRPDPNRKYHPESSVESFKDDLIAILKGDRQ